MHAGVEDMHAGVEDMHAGVEDMHAGVEGTGRSRGYNTCRSRGHK
jgi:hypothetical protein